MSKLRLRQGFPFLVLLVLAGLWWQGPLVLRRVPSRYIARLPEPLQTAAAPGPQAPLLPTARPPADTAGLLASSTLPGTRPPPLVSYGQENEEAEDEPVTRKERLVDRPAPAVTTALTPTPTSPPPPSAIRLQGFRHQFQTWNNCGPATVAMALSYFGLNLSQRETAAYLKPNPEDRNVSPQEMVAYVNEQTPYAALTRVNGSLETVKRLLAAGFPVIIELGIEPPGEYRWLGWYGHYLLLVAYDDAPAQFWVYDSWFGTSEAPMENATSEGRILTYADADRQWRQFNRTYIVLYEPERAGDVAALVGTDMNDGMMWQSALARAQRELQQEPKDAFLWFNLGSSYLALAEEDKAAAAFDQARAIGLPWRMLWYQFDPYEAYYRIGRYDEVILLADATLQERPYFEEAYYYKGMALAALGDMQAARENWQRAVAFNPNFTPAVQALAEATPE